MEIILKTVTLNVSQKFMHFHKIMQKKDIVLKKIV